MRTLILNKFLHRNGGSETYIFKLGEALEQHGHEVQYFGMDHEGRCVGIRVNAYTCDMDFHGGSKLSKLTLCLSGKWGWKLFRWKMLCPVLRAGVAFANIEDELII